MTTPRDPAVPLDLWAAREACAEDAGGYSDLYIAGERDHFSIVTWARRAVQLALAEERREHAAKVVGLVEALENVVEVTATHKIGIAQTVNRWCRAALATYVKEP